MESPPSFSKPVRGSNRNLFEVPSGMVAPVDNLEADSKSMGIARRRARSGELLQTSDERELMKYQ